MKLPNNVKKIITKELLEELHEDLIHFCLHCNADINSNERFCSKECMSADLLRTFELKIPVSAYTQEYHCHNCSGIMDIQQWTCSAVCLEEDLRKRK